MKYIQLTKGRHAVVDDGLFPILNMFGWHVDKGGYAIGGLNINGKWKRVPMHRVIMGLPERQWLVDHINGNRLDNRRANLRLVTERQNKWNASRQLRGSSQFKGVSYYRRLGLWHARIHLATKTVSLGYFKDELAAARAYDDAARVHFGEFARLNRA